MPVTNQTRPTAPIAATKGEFDAITLFGSATITTASTVNQAAVNLSRPPNAITFFLDVTAAANAVGDTLDVKVQTLIDGSTWIDVVHFTQVLGNGGVKQFVAKLTANAAEAMYATAALGAGSIKNIFGDQWRVVTTVVDGGAHGQSFTFSVTACPS